MASFINPNLPEYLQPASPSLRAQLDARAAESAAEGFRTSFLGQQRLNQEQREQNALLPLRQRLLDLQIKETANKVDDAVNARAGIADAASFMKQQAEAGQLTNDSTLSGLFGLGSKYPGLVYNQDFWKLIAQVDGARRAERAQETINIKTEASRLAQERFEESKRQFEATLASKEKALSQTLASRERIAALAAEGLRARLDRAEELARQRGISQAKITAFREKARTLENSIQAMTDPDAVKSQITGLENELLGSLQAPAPVSAASAPEVRTKAEFDKLPGGSPFTWVYPDGRRVTGRK